MPQHAITARSTARFAAGAILCIVQEQQSWVLAFAFVNSVVSFFQSFKINFVTASTLLIAFLLAARFSTPLLLWVSVALMLGALIVLYVRRFIVVFQPSIVFQAYLSIFPGLRKIMPDSCGLGADLRHVPRDTLDSKQLEKWTTQLQLAVLYNRACLFIAKKLQDYQSSKLNFLAYVFSLIALTIITILVFGGVNLALFKIEPAMFSRVDDPTVFAFIYYSFNNLFRTSANVISPTLPLSQFVYMLEVFFEFLLGALLVSLFFSVSNDRYVKELNKVVGGLEQDVAAHKETRKSGRVVEG
jgi:hypothetical protein